jgi:hypothetical protein
MLSKKDFEGVVNARLIQSEPQTRKIDSKTARTDALQHGTARQD